MPLQTALPTEEIAQYCRGNSIRRLRAFGSALRADCTAESDVHLPVAFEPDAPIARFDRVHRDEVRAAAEVLHVAS